MLDPETIAAQYLKPEDQAIKEKDFPERLQLAGIDNRAEVREGMVGAGCEGVTRAWVSG